MSSARRPDGGAGRPGEPAALAGQRRGGSRPRRSATRCWPSAARSTATMGGSLLARQEPRLPLRPHLEGRDRVRHAAAVALPAGRPQQPVRRVPAVRLPRRRRAQRRPGDHDRGPAGPVHDEQRAGRSSGRATWPPALLAAATADDAGRIRRLYELAYGRPPRPRPSWRRAAAFLDRFERRSRPRSRTPRERAPPRLAGPLPGHPGVERVRLHRVTRALTVDHSTASLTLAPADARSDCAVGLRRARPGRAAGRGIAAGRRPTAADGPARAEAAALPAAGQAGHLPVHEGRAVARRHVRPQAAARARRRQAAARSPSRACSSPRPATCSSSPWKFQQYGQSGMRGQRAVPARGRVRRRPVHHPLGPRHQPGPRRGAAQAAHRQRQLRPAEHGLVGHLRPGHREREPARRSSPSARRSPTAACNNWGSAFLPAAYQGTPLGNASVPVRPGPGPLHRERPTCRATCSGCSSTCSPR